MHEAGSYEKKDFGWKLMNRWGKRLVSGTIGAVGGGYVLNAVIAPDRYQVCSPIEHIFNYRLYKTATFLSPDIDLIQEKKNCGFPNDRTTTIPKISRNNDSEYPTKRESTRLNHEVFSTQPVREPLTEFPSDSDTVPTCT